MPGDVVCYSGDRLLGGRKQESLLAVKNCGQSEETSACTGRPADKLCLQRSRLPWIIT